MNNRRGCRFGATIIGIWLTVLGLLFSGAALAVSKTTTADHSKFKELQKTFASGPEVTKACLACHTEAAKQVHRTKHWTWEFLNPDSSQRLGKKNVINNFCISVASNYAFCTACHVGYGWKDDNFDFKSEANVDCLVCHDTTGKYRKLPGLAGHPAYKEMELPPGSGKIVKPVDLTQVAQKIGKTSRDTCGGCHFFSGGGDGVKHGDLDSSLTVPDHELDVHMDAAGLDFTCGTCHLTSAHDIPGSRYVPTAKDTEGRHLRGKVSKGNPATCVACHSDRPHSLKEARLNDHARKVACQTCHIPTIARGGVATKMIWDWSTSGKMDEKGKPIVKKDEKGHVIYDSKKGDFVLGENVEPEYQWFNGKVRFTLITDKVDKSAGVTPINRFDGSPDDGKSLIWPVKVFRGKQPFDPVNNTLVKPHTAGQDTTAYWTNFGWDKAITVGMASAKAPYSGKYDFIETEMRWPITHMVAPKDKALACIECHRADGRLKNIAGIYMPGRDSHGWLDLLGGGAAFFALLGVIGHGSLRIFSNRKGGK
ncbi:MAG: tetrathionate reductase family octaheme c-type cytochrome [Sulfuricaulis sp.]|uniref:tetrathionate reductase family octaheme c-type cytochrome n=1 Tax=Sulfuricaulis sp. TaxID=2003553 RepID=UPI0026007C9F|nr:tetrathionate reductase family octaheme c-type cytochrome [Sulfuricaulis sp.]MCR4347575.1 tetrathionate reductase family octaheme c-type cytochrome [Sulfuricaulis sp.]